MKTAETKTKASFLSKISHELKSPIHGIVSLSDFLEKNWDRVDDETKKNCVFEISKSSGALSALVESLFNYTAFDEGRIRFSLKKLDFLPLVNQVVKNMGVFLVCNPRLRIEFFSDISAGNILADELWFKQLLSNILINATKFSEKGLISVHVSEEHNDAGNFYKFSVSDEGLGIPENELVEVFNEFNSGSRQPENVNSTGLGLAICKEIVRAHGGKIWAANNEGVGITVTFLIPKV